MTDSISGTPFSLQFVLAKLQEAGVNGGCLRENLLDYDVTNIENGAAFMSHIFKVNLRWNNDAIEPKSVILKVPGVSDAIELYLDVNDSVLEDAETQGIKASHAEASRNAENFLILAHSFEFSKKHTDGLIIMEDLTPRATTIKMLPGMDDDQVLSMVNELTRIHTVSWKNPEWMTYLVNLERSEEFMSFTKTITQSLKQIKPEWFCELVDQLTPIFTTDIQDNVVYDTDHFGFPPAVVHGDLWAPNILWTKNENGRASSEVAAVIDWQMVHTGNPCEDIARLLSLNTSGAYRRSNTRRLLQHYTNKVTQLMDGKALFSLETLEEAYDEAMLYVATYTGFGAPMYYNMPAVVGYGPKKEANQLELLSRVHMFFEDTLAVLHKKQKLAQ